MKGTGLQKDLRLRWEKSQKYFSSLFSGISGRWLNYTIMLFFLLFLLLVFAVFFSLRTYFYTAADDYLAARFTPSVDNYFSTYVGKGDAVFEAGAKEYVSSFSEKENCTVWVINSQGDVVAASSGFVVENPRYPDYESAVSSGKKSTKYTGKNREGEHIKAATFLLESSESDQGYAVRYIVSMESVRVLLLVIMLLVIFVFLLLMMMIAYPSIYFIRSIVKPVVELNEVTKRIAAGDTEARAEVGEENDEISELARSLNSMADEIASTDKMKNDFISTVSHEMKTPLTAIKGWAETVQAVGESDPGLTQRAMEVIIGESARLTGVVEDLLDLSKISNGRLTLCYTKIDALAELDDTIFVFKDRSMREGIELVYNAPTVPAPMDGDADRIRQVFVNILDNAFKYNTQGGTVTVVATILPPEEEGKKGILQIQVEDTGCGIAAEELPKVKKKFYKSNISVRGSGIGLAVCDEIVKMHEGTLDLESELNVGTCVTIRLPIEYVPEEPTELEVAVNEAVNQQEFTSEESVTDGEQSTQD